MTFKDGDRVCREDGTWPGTIRGLKRPCVYNVELDAGGWSEAHESTISLLYDENRVIKITSCDGCPAFHITQCDIEYCDLANRDIEIDFDKYDMPPPDWCPLRRGKITIEIKK
jgi:hypothetical protein